MTQYDDTGHCQYCADESVNETVQMSLYWQYDDTEKKSDMYSLESYPI